MVDVDVWGRVVCVIVVEVVDAATVVEVAVDGGAEVVSATVVETCSR